MSLEIIALVNGVVAWLKSSKKVLLTVCLGCGSLLALPLVAVRLALPWLVLPNSFKLGLVIVLCFLLPLFAVTAVDEFWLRPRRERRQRREITAALLNLMPDEKQVISRILKSSDAAAEFKHSNGRLPFGSAIMELERKGLLTGGVSYTFEESVASTYRLTPLANSCARTPAVKTAILESTTI